MTPKKPPDPNKKHPGRPDRTVANWERDYYRYLVIKQRLPKFVKEQTILPIIQHCVATVNEITWLAYHLLNFHFLRLVEDPTLVTEIPKSISQTMINHACLAVSTCNGKETTATGKKEWVHSISLFRQVVKVVPPRDNCCNLINNTKQQMNIAITNHFELNFRSRLAKYLRLLYQENDLCRAYYWTDRILNKRTHNPQHPSKFADQKAEQIIVQYQKELKIKTGCPEISNHLDIYLPFYHKISKLLAQRGKKGFSLLPLKGELIPGYIKICNSSLGDMLSRGGETNGKAKVLNNKAYWWGKLFNISQIETHKHRFDWEIVTNGYDVSIVLKSQQVPFPKDYNLDWSPEKKVEYIKSLPYKKKKNKVKDKLNDTTITEYLRTLHWSDWDAHLGLDTGRRRLFSGISGTGKDAIKVQCTSGDWQSMVGTKDRQRRINARKDQNPLITELNKFSFKVVSSQQYLQNLKSVLPKMGPIFDFYNKSFYRKEKFSYYIKRQKAFDRVVKRLQIGERTLVGLGNGNINGRGCIRGRKLPVKDLYKRVNREPGMMGVWVNEAYTSKMCSECRRVTKGEIKEWKIVEKLSGELMLIKCTIYGLRRCGNNECRITWDRDHNARRNIYMIMKSEIINGCRPEYVTTGKNPKIQYLKKPRRDTLLAPIDKSTYLGVSCITVLPDSPHVSHSGCKGV